ncbi:MAG: NrtA/SsuA/CpmA family ABC transporter substrate-binding protein [Candidatus Diapherotrites archaeon]|uniref:NrtA/SsuA/CpmA family ABC transporter substrate-binding protein n=1 Tax=Candidatus Iainarchaeum sp. TaxID=3101447 RepID=A0A8T4KUI3_9ARCH|nr:NrtA/SsuA/CpmA family ABC transporter substrate-binding protein [Candidatus Diapherotrites archaeon]
MNKKIIISAAAVIIVALLIFIWPGGQVNESDKVPINIGWQVAWATQGQIAQTLKHTDFLEKNGLMPEFKAFSYGGPLIEAAITGDVDIIFVADMPAITLLSKGVKWKIVARLIDFRDAIIVPKASSINSLDDLKGKNITTPFSSGAHIGTLKLLKESGLEKDVKLINLDVLEQAAIVQKGTDKSWGEIDAIASWDPNIALFEHQGKARVLESFFPVAVVVMSEDFIKRNPAAAKNFLKSYVEAYYYYATHQKEANKWFMEEARIKFDESILDIAASYEKNLEAKTIAEIDVLITERHINQMQEIADLAYAQGLISGLPNIRKSTDNSLLEGALKGN